jgi:hypothetical protein
MTPVQRRTQLLAIFYYQTTESKERRVEKVVEEDCGWLRGNRGIASKHLIECIDSRGPAHSGIDWEIKMES